MNDKPLPIREHLLELRRRLTYSVIAVLVCSALAFAFHQTILRLLMEPAAQFVDLPFGKPVYTDLTEYLSIAAKTSLLTGLFISLPFVLYQIVMFISPGLKPSERRYLYALIPVSLLAFAAGALFGYRILFPPMVNFLLNFGADVAIPMIRIGRYMDLMLRLLFWMGLIFEMPVVTFFLARIGVLSPDFLARHRRYAIVLAFILGAIITPTFDPINQALVAAPIIILYEVSVWIAKVSARSRRQSPAPETGYGG